MSLHFCMSTAWNSCLIFRISSAVLLSGQRTDCMEKETSGRQCELTALSLADLACMLKWTCTRFFSLDERMCSYSSWRFSAVSKLARGKRREPVATLAFWTDSSGKDDRHAE